MRYRSEGECPLDCCFVTIIIPFVVIKKKGSDQRVRLLVGENREFCGFYQDWFC